MERTDAIFGAAADAADLRRRMGAAALEMDAASDTQAAGFIEKCPCSGNSDCIVSDKAMSFDEDTFRRLSTLVGRWEWRSKTDTMTHSFDVLLTPRRR
jgi:hypothetical protein